MIHEWQKYVCMGLWNYYMLLSWYLISLESECGYNIKQVVVTMYILKWYLWD